MGGAQSAYPQPPQQDSATLIDGLNRVEQGFIIFEEMSRGTD